MNVTNPVPNCRPCVHVVCGISFKFAVIVCSFDELFIAMIDLTLHTVIPKTLWHCIYRVPICNVTHRSAYGYKSTRIWNAMRARRRINCESIQNHLNRVKS